MLIVTEPCCKRFPFEEQNADNLKWMSARRGVLVGEGESNPRTLSHDLLMRRENEKVKS